MALLTVLGAEGGNLTYGLTSYGAQVTINSTSPKTGVYDYSCRMTTNADNGQFISQRIAPSGGGQKNWVYFHFMVTALPTAEMTLHAGSFSKTGTLYNERVVINTDGTLEVYLNNVSKAISANAISANTWYWGKAEWYFPGTGFNAYCNVDINGSEWVTGSLADLTATAYMAFGDVCPAGSNFGTTLRIDNIVSNDTTTGSPTTELTQEIYVLKASPSADGDYEDISWIGVSDNTDKYKNWDELPYNGTGTTDSDYNETSSTDQKLTSTMPNAATIGISSDKTIVGMAIEGWGRRTDNNKEHHGPMIRMDNTDILFSKTAWADQNYASAVYASAPCIRVTNESNTALVPADFNDWELGWYTVTASGEAHSTNIHISAVWVEIAYYTPAATATLTGTCVPTITEANVVSGGKTIIITLANDTWVADGATFNAQRQNIINGLDSAQSEAHGWDVEVKGKIAVTDVVRTSDTVVTTTLDAEAGYDITATETITATIPATAVVKAGAIVATPTFTVTAVGGAVVDIIQEGLIPFAR